MKCPKCSSKNVARERRPNGNDICGDCGHVWPSNGNKVQNREPYLDEDHLYNKYESMKMANERNMKEKLEAQKKRKALESLLTELREMNSNGHWPRLSKALEKYDSETCDN